LIALAAAYAGNDNTARQTRNDLLIEQAADRFHATNLGWYAEQSERLLA